MGPTTTTLLRLHRHHLRRLISPPIPNPNPRFLSWTPWPRNTPNPTIGSETWSDPTPNIGSEGTDSSGIVEDCGSAGSLNSGWGLGLVDGCGSGMDVAGADSLWDAPVRALTAVMDGFHDVSGLPWWMTIFASTLALRVSLLPVLVLQLKKMERFAELIPKLPPPLPPRLSGRSFREQYFLFQKKRRELRCPSYFWSLAFFTVQFPSFLLGMTTISSMCLDHHPGFDNGGTLWFQNLTDFPHGLLGPTFPILIAALHYINVQISFQNFKADALPGILGLLAKSYRLYLDLLSIPLLLIGFYIPQGSLVYWLTNSSLTLIQLLSLKDPYIRSKLGLGEEKNWKKMSTNNATLEDSHFSEDLYPEELLDLSLEHLAAGHQDKALVLLRIATEKDPELVRAIIAMGQILCSKESFEEAAEYFELAISKIQHEENDSLLILSLFGAGVSRIWQGKTSEGMEHLKQIAELEEPDDPMDKVCYHRGLVMLGSALFEEGEKSEAAKYWRIAATYDPGVHMYLKQCAEG